MRSQARIAAARRKRFWRACFSAFVTIHLLILFIVAFVVQSGFWFTAAAPLIVFGVALRHMQYRAEVELDSFREKFQPTVLAEEGAAVPDTDLRPVMDAAVRVAVTPLCCLDKGERR